MSVTDVSLRCRVTSGFSFSPRMMLPTERARMAFWAALSTPLCLEVRSPLLELARESPLYSPTVTCTPAAAFSTKVGAITDK